MKEVKNNTKVVIEERVCYFWTCPKCGIENEEKSKFGVIQDVLECEHCGFETDDWDVEGLVI